MRTNGSGRGTCTPTAARDSSPIKEIPESSNPSDQLLARLRIAHRREDAARRYASTRQERAERVRRVSAINAAIVSVTDGVSPCALPADLEQIREGFAILAEHGVRPAMPLSPSQLTLFDVAGGEA